MPRKISPLDDPNVTVEPPRPGFVHLAAVISALALFGWFYFFLANILIESTNQDINASDQKHGINRSVLTAQSERAGLTDWWPHETDGIVAPLWPQVAGTFVADDHPVSTNVVTSEDEVLFKKGKWFNVIFAFCFLCVLTLGTAWMLPNSTLACVNLMLIAGLGAALPRAVYFHPEPIYYALFTGAWISCLLALLGNRWWPYFAAGAFAGLAYLTKTSIQPMLIAFAAISLFRICFGLLGIGRNELNPFSLVKCVGGFVVIIAIFVAIIMPRLEFSQKKFGDRFHTYPGYWMWMDDFESGFTWMQEHPNRTTLSSIPDSEKPSAFNYWRSHSWDDISTRATTGWRKAIQRSLFPIRKKQWGWEPRAEWKHLLPGRGWYLLSLLGIFMGSALVAKRFGIPRASDGQRFIPRATSGDRFLAAVFVAVLTTGYSFAYGWYEAIGGGERFILALVCPLAFSLVWGAEAMMRHLSPFSRLRLVYIGAHVAILGFLLFRIANLLLHPEFWEAARA